MKKDQLSERLRILASDAAANGMSPADIHDVYWNCYECEIAETDRTCTKEENGGITTPRKLSEGLEKGDVNISEGRKACAIKKNEGPKRVTWITVSLGVVALACTAQLFTFFSNIQGTVCLIDSATTFTEVYRPLNNCSRCSDITSVPVIQLSDLTQDDFLEHYAYTSVPLLIKGAASQWPAINLFSYQYFKSLYTEHPGSFEHVEKNCQFFSYKSKIYDLKDLMNISEARARLDEGEKSWYIGWCDSDSQTGDELQRHYRRPDFLPDLTSDNHFTTDWIFMGWPGEGALMHIDHVTAPSWQAQIHGTKTWMLVPSVECEEICRPLNVTMETGDILTIDTNKWFHSTYIHEGDISISIGSEY